MSTEALNNPPAIIGAIEASQMAVDVVQAINRARCRRVVDDHGRCEPVDVYIRLPRDAKGSRREKAEALLHLRCIELNGDWQHFFAWTQQRFKRRLARGQRVKVLTDQPLTLAKAA